VSELVAIVLAAGRGERVGGPKALLAWRSRGRDVPLAIAHAEARLEGDSARAVLVVRHRHVAPLAPFVGDAVHVIESEAPEEVGPAGSLAYATRALAGEPLVLVTPVDAVPASEAIVRRLRAALGADPALLAVRPRFEGRRGHPVLLRATALEPYRRGDAPPLRDHLRALGPAALDVDVDDASVLEDLDTPADVERVTGRAPVFFGET
jgi:CTP:molybdopterin cytidylyltransferase MocA